MQGDCLLRMKELEDNSVDSVVTDAPYGISFMNKAWDHQVPSVEIWKECLRVIKPGGYLLSFAGTRTQHRMACNIEDAGFEIRDMIAWVYAQGMPKHKSSLKPALEPITLARKPAKKATLLNIDECRVPHITVGDGTNLALNSHLRKSINGGNGGNIISHEENRRVVIPNQQGRYPSNLIHDGSEEVVELFPDSLGAGGSLPQVKITGYGDKNVGTGKSEYFGGERIPFDSGSGSAARFFYAAKSNKKDRGEGNSHPTVKPTELMRYLVRLITPVEGIVLDPFMGSGSTGKAAMLEDRKFIGCEMDEGYFEIAKNRILNATVNKSLDTLDKQQNS